MTKIAGRIECEIICTDLAKRRDIIKIYYGREPFDARIYSVEGRQLVIERITPIENALIFGRRVSCYFDYQGAKFTMVLRVIEEQKKFITLQIISPLSQGIEREFMRIHNIDDIKIEVTKMTTHPTHSYPPTQIDTGALLSRARHRIYSENIAELNKAFKEQMITRSLEYEVILFRTRKTISLLENIVARVGKLLLLPIPAESNEKIVSAKEFSNACNALGRHNPTEILSQCHTALRERSIAFQCYCPIFFGKFCVGYIVIAGKREEEARQLHKIIEYIIDTTVYFSHALEASGYFQNVTGSSSQKPEKVPTRKPITRLKDISLTGLLFQYFSPQKIFEKGELLAITIQPNSPHSHDTLRLTARAVRIIDESNAHSVGVQFTDITESVRTQLQRAVYDKVENINE